MRKKHPARFRLANEINSRMAILYFGIYLVILALLLLLLVPQLYRNADNQAANALDSAADTFQTVQNNLSGYSGFLDGDLSECLKEYDENPSDSSVANIELLLSGFTSHQGLLMAATLEDMDHHFFQSQSFHNVISREWLEADTHYQKLFGYTNANYFSFYDNTVFVLDSDVYDSTYYAMSYTKIQYFNQKPYLLTIFYNMNTVMNHAAAFFDGLFTNFAIYSEADGLLYAEGNKFENDPDAIGELFDYHLSSGSRWEGLGRYYYVMDSSSGWSYVVYSPFYLFLSDALIIAGIIMLLYLISPLLYTLLLYPITNHSLAPLNQLYDAMKHYNAGEPQEPLQIRTGNEIEELSEIYNEMVEKIDVQIEDIKNQEQINAVTNYKLLSTQIDPHFIYNTMNVINILARQGKNEEIVEVNSALIKILRDRLSSKLTISNTIEAEVDSLYQYQIIMQHRFENRIQLSVDVDEALLSYEIPKNILQPLAENSFYHGFANLPEGTEGTIEVLIYSVDDQIVIEMSDNGSGIAPDRLKDLKEHSAELYADNQSHIGLDNIQQRLDYIYSGNYQFEIYSSEGYGTTISITIPMEVPEEIKSKVF